MWAKIYRVQRRERITGVRRDGGEAKVCKGLCWLYVHHGVSLLRVLSTPRLCQLVKEST